MDQFAVLAILHARSGKEKEVEDFLKSAQPMVLQEPGTTNGFALKLGPAQFVIFDTFPSGLDAHFTGEVARALFAEAEELFAEPPRIEQGKILASKASRT